MRILFNLDDPRQLLILLYTFQFDHHSNMTFVSSQLSHDTIHPANSPDPAIEFNKRMFIFDGTEKVYNTMSAASHERYRCSLYFVVAHTYPSPTTHNS